MILGMTLLGAMGGLFFKRSSRYSIGINKLFITNLFIGGCFYLLGALLNIIILKKLPYMIVYPLTSVTYIWTMMISKFFLNEQISRERIMGVILIILGAILLVI
ncbi:EamA family transporter [Paenibacillus sp. FSL E2-8871]|uniref:EamA family transporter n=1 Tax=Paenibacillus sp. FSL E2-8871 TaxID=2975326 RepID=UPI0030F94912